MKNSLTKLAIVITIALFNLNAFTASATHLSPPQFAETIFVNGKAYPLINLPSAEVNASGTAKEGSFNKENINLLVSNSSKMVMVTKQNGVYMPTILLAEARVVALRKDISNHLSLKEVFTSIFSFVFTNAAHFGIIR